MLAHVGVPADTDITAASGRAAVIAAINTAFEGAFTEPQFDQAWAVALAVAGSAGPWSLPQIFEMLPAATHSMRGAGQHSSHSARPEPEPVTRKAVLRSVAPHSRPDLLTVDDLAAALQISRSTAYRLATQVPGRRIPGVGLRFRRHDVEAFVAGSNAGALATSKSQRTRKHGRPVAGDDQVVVNGLTRRQLRDKAGF